MSPGESLITTSAKTQDGGQSSRSLFRIRTRAASLALLAAVGLTVLKFGAGWLSGSVGVLSEGIHSFLDLISAGVAFFTIREAGKPADLEHPFGHGKFETLSSLLESLLLLAAAGFIVYEGVGRLHDPHPLRMPGVAIGVIGFSLIASYIVYANNLQAAKVTESAAIHVNALHFLADMVAGGSVLVGLVIIHWTGWVWLDPLLAFGIAIYILAISSRQIKKSLGDLVDVGLPAEEVGQIEKVLGIFREHILGVHDLRTRRSGSMRHIDFHMVVCGKMSVSESHSICDEIEEKVTKVFPQSLVNIHVEPCESETPDCQETCVFRRNQ